MRRYALYQGGCYELIGSNGPFQRLPDNRFCEQGFGKVWYHPNSDVMIDFMHRGLMPQIKGGSEDTFGTGVLDTLFYTDARYADPRGLVFAANRRGDVIRDPIEGVWEGARSLRRVGCYVPQPAIPANADEYFHRSRLYFLAETWGGEEVVMEIIFAEVELDEGEARNPRLDTWKQMQVNLVNVYGGFPRVSAVDGDIVGRFQDRYVNVDADQQGCGGQSAEGRWKPKMLFPDAETDTSGSPGNSVIVGPTMDPN